MLPSGCRDSAANYGTGRYEKERAGNRIGLVLSHEMAKSAPRNNNLKSAHCHSIPGASTEEALVTQGFFVSCHTNTSPVAPRGASSLRSTVVVALGSQPQDHLDVSLRGDHLALHRPATPEDLRVGSRSR